MQLYELAALAAAASWALSGIISAGPSAHMGAMAYSRLRMSMVFVMLAVAALFTGGCGTLTADIVPALLASGVIGIFVGDTALFLAMNRLGPRRTSILFAMNAPMAVLLGWLVLGERLEPLPLFGVGVCMAGVVLAIVFGKRRSQLHTWEDVKGPLWIGIALGLLAAAGQAVGALIARPVMAGGVDPVAASAVRVGISAVALIAAMQLPIAGFKQRNPPTWRIAGLVALSGFMAMGVGMTLILFALASGKVGVVSVLSATTPVMILPMIWASTRERPAIGAWFGAVLVVVGSALLFNA